MTENTPVHPKGDQSWVLIGGTDAEAETPILWSFNSLEFQSSCKGLTHWKRPWCWEGLGEGGEGDDRGWDGWMASLTWWTWVWMNSGSWWWTGRPGVLQFMGPQRVRHDWVTELNWESEQYPERSLGAVTLGSKISKVLLFSMFLLLLLFFLSLHTAPSLSTKPRNCCFSLFMRMTRGLNGPWICALTFLYAIIWKHTIKPLKVTADTTGYSSVQCNVKSLTVQFLKYSCHINMVYNVCPFLCFKPYLLGTV